MCPKRLRSQLHWCQLQCRSQRRKRNPIPRLQGQLKARCGKSLRMRQKIRHEYCQSKTGSIQRKEKRSHFQDCLNAKPESHLFGDHCMDPAFRTISGGGDFEPSLQCDKQFHGHEKDHCCGIYPNRYLKTTFDTPYHYLIKVPVWH